MHQMPFLQSSVQVFVHIPELDAGYAEECMADPNQIELQVHEYFENGKGHFLISVFSEKFKYLLLLFLFS